MIKMELYDLVMAYGEYLEEEDYSEENTASLFTEDAKMLFAMGGPGQGIAELSEKHRGMTEPFTAVTHNITNVFSRLTGENSAEVRFHMEVVHEFRPEIAEKLPGNLFIVNDRIRARAIKTDSGWRFCEMEMNTVFKRMVQSAQ